MCIHTYLHKHICGYLVSCDTQGMSYCRSIVRKAEKHWSKEDFHSFTSGWPVFPAPVVKEVVFFPLYIHVSFVKDKVSVGTWIYLWAFCLCASTILSWWLWLCSRAWSQVGWFLQFHSSFSRLLWLFEVFCISIQIVKLFVLVLWRIPLVLLHVSQNGCYPKVYKQ